MKQAERAELTRRKIMKAAMKEFGVNGYRGGTIGNICKTGINKGLVYHYFESRDELYLECVKDCCGKLCGKLDETVRSRTDTGRGGRTKTEPEEVVRRYMKVRMDFYKENPEETRILFDCLFDTPANLRQQIDRILKPLEERNMQICAELLSGLKLRSGMTIEKAEKYLSLLQYMFNAYFGSPAMQEKSLDERITLHEQNVPEILDCMLYGIAEKKPESKQHERRKLK
ncbi:MAG: TetR/AcrR family transcriptional regulator [Bilifractor sp.]|jgi:AcrR family transcriptional regulator